jgi:hypothetical protein
VRKEDSPDGDVGKRVGGTRTVEGEHHRKDMIRGGRERSESITKIIVIPRCGLYH